MALLDAAQWQRRAENQVPGWWFSQEPDVQRAVMAGIGAVFAAINFQAAEHYRMTKIGPGGAEGLYLDAHGEERNVERLPSEPDDVYRERIRNIVNSSNYPAIKALVDALLVVGESTIWEHDYGQFLTCDRESFFNRSEVFTEIKYNTFTVVVDNQLHDPYSFFDREYFLNREDAVGTLTSSLAIFERIVEAVNKAKAYGVLYRFLERDAA